MFSFSLRPKVAKAATLSLAPVLDQQSASNRAVRRSTSARGLGNLIFTLRRQTCTSLGRGERKVIGTLSLACRLSKQMPWLLRLELFGESWKFNVRRGWLE